MGFTWLTFRMFGLPLAYTAAVLCAACALLPFIPTYVIALPPCLMLGTQVGGGGRVLGLAGAGWASSARGQEWEHAACRGCFCAWEGLRIRACLPHRCHRPA